MDTILPLELVTEASPPPPLEAAAQRVASRLHELFPALEQGDHDGLRPRVGALAVAVGRIATGRAPSAAPELGTAAVNVLLDRLEHEILWHEEGGEGTEVVQLLRACSAYRRTHGTASPADLSRSEDLRTRMLGPAAFELLVEVAHDFRSPLTSILFLSEAL